MPTDQRLAPHEALADGHEAALAFAATVGRARAEIEAAGGAGLAALAPAIRALRRIEALLRHPLRLALMGEFNSGKSTLANLLIGNAPLPTLRLSNTRIPTLIHYAPEPMVAAVLEDGSKQRLTTEAPTPLAEMLRIQLGMPMPHLRACEIIDFPGISDPWLSYGALDIGRHPVDAVLWCTFATQAWKESEAAVWRLLPEHMRRHAMLSVTSKDLLSEEQSAKVMARLRKATTDTFADHALISALQARKAIDRDGGVQDAGIWRMSGAADFYGRLQALLGGLRARRLEKAKAMTHAIAGAAIARLAGGTG
ncbi:MULTISPECIES: dynamin family protein [Rhodomicrobium]|uniref:dynamin family protein n=1 Tax=Rhodomicrobium TaxID=1068 RepID=UPI001482205A|nr:MULTISPECIES: dynamin family protein [Rhodomicrobium]